MAHLTLPATHSEADALLAEHIGDALDLEAIHVFWTLPGREPASQEGEPPALVAAVTGLARMIGRLVAPLRSDAQRR